MEKETWQQKGEAPLFHPEGTCSDAIIHSFIISFIHSVIHPKWTRVGRGQLLSSFILDGQFSLTD